MPENLVSEPDLSTPPGNISKPFTGIAAVTRFPAATTDNFRPANKLPTSQ
jgi:hypothetical protein